MTAPDVIDAHPAADDERHQVVTTLCRAFVDDRIYRWMVPDDAQRRRSAAIFYARFVDACWPHGQVYAAPLSARTPGRRDAGRHSCAQRHDVGEQCAWFDAADLLVPASGRIRACNGAVLRLVTRAYGSSDSRGNLCHVETTADLGTASVHH